MSQTTEPPLRDALWLGHLRLVNGEDLPEPLIRQVAGDVGLTWRQRLLTPAATAHLFLTQVLHGNTAVGHLRHLCGLDFTDAAYCQARARLPFGFFQRLQRLATGRLAATGGRDGRWRGHRTFRIDGSSFSMPDTPELRQEFGVRPVNRVAT